MLKKIENLEPFVDKYEKINKNYVDLIKEQRLL